jgi:hypothetical protein
MMTMMTTRSLSTSTAASAAAKSTASASIRATPSRSRARVLHRSPASARQRERMPVDPYTRPPVTYVQLLQHIRLASDVQALEALLDAHGARFDAVHAAAALSVLPKLTSAAALERPTPEGSRRPARLMARLQALAVQHRERMHARQIANAVWSAGRCRQLVSTAARDERRRAVGAQRLPASALLQAAQQEEEEAAAAEGSSTDVATTTARPTAQLLALEREQGRARLRQQRSEAAAPRWRGDAVGAALAQFPTSPDLDAGPTAASRAAVRELLSELGRGGFRKLYQGGTPADAAQLLHGLARLRLPPPPSLHRHLRAFVAKRCGEFDARHLAVSTWALARLGGLEREAQRQQAWRRRKQQQSDGASPPPPSYRRRAEGLAAPLPADLAEVIVARALQQADFFRPWSMCAMLYAFARPAPPPAAKQQQQQQQEGGEGAVEGGEGAAAEEAAADYRALGRALAEAFAAGVVAEADARAPTPQQTATLAWAYGRLRVWGQAGGGGEGEAVAEAVDSSTTSTVAAALARCALESLETFGPTDLSLLVSGLAESAAAGAREQQPSAGASFALPPDVARLLGAVARGISEERAVRLSSAEDAARLLRGYATLAGKGLFPVAGDDEDAADQAAAAVEGMALRLAGGAAAHARAAPATTARELATLLPRLLLLRRRGRSGLAVEGGEGQEEEQGQEEALAVATADLARAAAEGGLPSPSPSSSFGGNDEDEGEWGGINHRSFEGTEAADLLDALADAAADRGGSKDARLLAALLHARGALGLPAHDALCRQAAARLAALAAQVQELAGSAAGHAAASPSSSSSSSPLLRPLEQATDLAVGLADARRLGAESGAAAARAALAASAAAAEPKPKLRTLARLCRALSSDVAVMQQAPVRSLFEACAGPLAVEGGGGDAGLVLPAGAAAAAAVAFARAVRHGHAQGAAASRELVLRLADAAEAAVVGGSASASASASVSAAAIARDVDEARACIAAADAAADEAAQAARR